MPTGHTFEHKEMDSAFIRVIARRGAIRKTQIEIRIGKEIKATACKQRDRLLRNGAIVTVGVPSGRVSNCFSLYLLGSGTGVGRYWLEDV